MRWWASVIPAAPEADVTGIQGQVGQGSKT